METITLRIPQKNRKDFILRDLMFVAFLLIFVYVFVMTLIYFVEGGVQKNFFKFLLYFGLGICALVVMRIPSSVGIANAIEIQYNEKGINYYLNSSKTSFYLKLIFLLKPRAKYLHQHEFLWEQVCEINESKNKLTIIYSSPIIKQIKGKLKIINLFDGYEDL